MQMAYRLCHSASHPFQVPLWSDGNTSYARGEGQHLLRPSRGDDAALGTRGTAAIGPLNEETCTSPEDLLTDWLYWRPEFDNRMFEGNVSMME